MTMSLGQEAAVQALAVGTPQRIGRFEYAVADDSWSWSDTFSQILGLTPGEVVPALSVLAAHLRPDGSHRGLEAVESTFVSGGEFSIHTRIVDARGAQRTVLLMGRGEPEDGVVARVVGYLVDLTESRRLASQVDVQEALTGVLEHRAVIEQAKGVLMLAHSVDADAAFDLLRVYSQNKNIKVRDLADHLVELVAKDGEANQGSLSKVLQILDAVDSARGSASARQSAPPDLGD